MNNSSPLHDYILTQLNAGLAKQDITVQLQQAGWDAASIQAGFESVGQTLSAAPVQQASTPLSLDQQTEPENTTLEEVSSDEASGTASTTIEPQQQTLPAPLKRGRLKIGWLLFKQSLMIIKHTPGLITYVVLSLLVTLAIELVAGVIIVLDSLFWHAITGNNIIFYAMVYVVAVILTFVTYFFATALSAHVLASFRGETSTYHDNIALARSKSGAIASYALITTTIGFILRFIEERFQLIGWIISKLLGALWSLATVFTLPVIADTNKSGFTAVKESLHLFKANWGQTIVGRVAVGGLAMLFFILIMIPVFLLISFALFPLIGPFALLLGLALFIIGMVALSILISLATNILNVCLYYYAQYHAVPPAFDPALLASVFVEKKKKRQ
jgi:hypothetical protein